MAESGLRCVMFFKSRCYGRVVHLGQLPTSCCHDAVAFDYRRVNVPPDGDFHPAVETPSQAHERGIHPAGSLEPPDAPSPGKEPRRRNNSIPLCCLGDLLFKPQFQSSRSRPFAFFWLPPQLRIPSKNEIHGNF